MRVRQNPSRRLLVCYAPILSIILALFLVSDQLNVLATKKTRSNEFPISKSDPKHEQQQQQQQVAANDINSSYGPRHTHPLAAITPFGGSFNLLEIFNLFGQKKANKDPAQDLSEPLDPQDVSLDKPQLLSEQYKDEISQSNQIKIEIDKQNMILEDNHVRESSLDDTLLRSPVILLPGYGGSRLEARLDKPKRVHYFCEQKFADWTDAWVNVKLLLPYMIDCLIDNLRLEYDYDTNTTRNTAGVEIRVKNDEHVSSVEYLNDIQINGFAYFAPIIEKLITAMNYTRETDLLGAPYDFRKAPNEMGHYFERLKVRTEQAYEANGQQPATYICHSMGCNNLLYFLQRQSDEWKKTYIKRMISIAAPWGGCLMALKAAAMGHDLGMPYLFSDSQLIKVQRSLPSTIYLFPHKNAFDSAPLIRTNVQLSGSNTSSLDRHISTINLTPKKMVARQSDREQRTYFAKDLTQFFEDIAHPDGYRMWLDTKDLLRSLDAPGVELWCLVGRGHKTLGRMEYLGDFPASPSIDLYDDGDGTVTVQSASYCKRWIDDQKDPVHYREFPVGHAEMLKDSQVLTYIEDIMRS